jgi:hypothetical protein
VKASLKREARSKIGKLQAVKSHDTFTTPRGLTHGVYFVSAKVRGFGIATWAASTSEYNTGGGLLIGVGTVARLVSDAGTDLPRSTLKLWNLTTHTNGYAESRRCVS